MDAQHISGPVCRLPSGRIVGCEYLNGDPLTSVLHPFGCQCSRCEPPEESAKLERIRAAAPDLLVALQDCVERYAVSANCICDWSQDRQGAHESHCPIYTVMFACAAIAKAVQP